MTTAADAGVRLTVVSDAAGRMRVHATGFRFDVVRAVAIEDTVAKVAGVQAVHAYPRTASVVIWYSRAIRDTAAILSAIVDAQGSRRRRCLRGLRARPTSARSV